MENVPGHLSLGAAEVLADLAALGYDATWTIVIKYLDMLSGYGVFGLGRNHPDVRRVLNEFLEMDYPSLVKMEAPLLSGLLAQELKKRMPNQLDMVFFTNSGAEGVETALKYAKCATGKPAILHCQKSFHGLSYGALSVNGDNSFREGFACPSWRIAARFPSTTWKPWNRS